MRSEEQQDKVEWMFEVTRRDGGDIDSDEILTALRLRSGWNWLMLRRMKVSDDGEVRIGRGRFQFLRQPAGAKDRLIICTPDTKTLRQLNLFGLVLRFALWGHYGGSPRFRFLRICRSRRFAYCGRIPKSIAEFTAPFLGFKLRNRFLFLALFFVLFYPLLFTFQLVLLPLAFGMSPPIIYMYRQLAESFGSGNYAHAIAQMFFPLVFSFFFIYAAVFVGVVFLHRVGVIGDGVRWFNRLHRKMSESVCWSAVAANLCHACGYDLRESDNDLCPECGHPNLRWWCERDRLAEAAMALPKSEGE
jgi:hypothetical protein